MILGRWSRWTGGYWHSGHQVLRIRDSDKSPRDSIMIDKGKDKVIILEFPTLS